MGYSFRAPDRFEAFMETPFDCFLDRFIEDEGEEGDGEEAELCILSVPLSIWTKKGEKMREDWRKHARKG